MNIWAVMEAVASVSLSHDEDCRCLTCRAALDEPGAMADLLADLQAREDVGSGLAAAPAVVSPEQQEGPNDAGVLGKRIRDALLRAGSESTYLVDPQSLTAIPGSYKRAPKERVAIAALDELLALAAPPSPEQEQQP